MVWLYCTIGHAFGRYLPCPHVRGRPVSDLTRPKRHSILRSVPPPMGEGFTRPRCRHLAIQECDMDASTKAATVRRLQSVEGHVRGIQRMVEEDKYCIDVLKQGEAVP